MLNDTSATSNIGACGCSKNFKGTMCELAVERPVTPVPGPTEVVTAWSQFWVLLGWYWIAVFVGAFILFCCPLFWYCYMRSCSKRARRNLEIAIQRELEDEHIPVGMPGEEAAAKRMLLSTNHVQPVINDSSDSLSSDSDQAPRRKTKQTLKQKRNKQRVIIFRSNLFVCSFCLLLCRILLFIYFSITLQTNTTTLKHNKITKEIKIMTNNAHNNTIIITGREATVV